MDDDESRRNELVNTLVKALSGSVIRGARQSAVDAAAGVLDVFAAQVQGFVVTGSPEAVAGAQEALNQVVGAAIQSANAIRESISGDGEFRNS